ncbi:hypothetical protein WJU23_23140 [Prosthecobacter sp. SYSU 5D2]
MPRLKLFIAATCVSVIGSLDLWVGLSRTGWAYWNAWIQFPFGILLAFYGIFRVMFIQLALGWTAVLLFLVSLLAAAVQWQHPEQSTEWVFLLSAALASAITAYLLLLDPEVRAFRTRQPRRV